MCVTRSKTQHRITSYTHLLSFMSVSYKSSLVFQNNMPAFCDSAGTINPQLGDANSFSQIIEYKRILLVSFLSIAHTHTHTHTIACFIPLDRTHTHTHTHTSLFHSSRSHTHTHTHTHNCLTDCSTLQHNATHCNTLHHTATNCNTLSHTTAHCNTLQHIAAHCNTLQQTAIY